jgi:hypothetical protein
VIWRRPPACWLLERFGKLRLLRASEKAGPGRTILIGINWRNSPKNIYQSTVHNRTILKSPAFGDFFELVRWTDSDTAVFWAFSTDAKAGALCELKVDANGDWKFVKAKVLSGKAAEKQQEGD